MVQGPLEPLQPPSQERCCGEEEKGEVLPSPSAPFFGRALQLMWCKSHPASLLPSPPCSAGRWVVGFVAGSSVGVTFHCSFSPLCPPSASLWLWEADDLPLGNGDPSVVVVFLETEGVGVNEEVGLAWKNPVGAWFETGVVPPSRALGHIRRTFNRGVLGGVWLGMEMGAHKEEVAVPCCMWASSDQLSSYFP